MDQILKTNITQKGGLMKILPNKFTFFLLLILLWPAAVAFAADQATDAENQIIRIALNQEPPQLNSFLTEDSVSMMVLGHVMEGLLCYDRRGRLAPGVAERWDIDSKGATFYLRKNALWSDGKPVTAKDFVFAWRMAVDPKVASEYAFIVYPVKNAEAINTGEIKDLTQLGVKAIDDYTLKVDFEYPCGYFLGLAAFSTYFPVREDYYKTMGSKYAAEASNLLFNGAFKLTKWVHGASLRMEKNEKYWNKDAVTLSVIDCPYITSDTTALLNLFKDDKIVVAELDSETIKTAMKSQMKIRKFDSGRLRYIVFNHRDGKVTANLNFRKALRAVFDPQVFADKVVGVPGTLPGRSVMLSFLEGVNDKFRKEYPVPIHKVDKAAAKEFLAKAKKELGIDTFPPLVLLCDDTPSIAKMGEYLQGLFNGALGLDIKLDKQIFKQRLAKASAGEFDMVIGGWLPDYDDPMTYAELFASWNANNSGKWKNAVYDENIRIASKSVDPKVRMDAFAKCQQAMYEDIGVIPLFEGSNVYVQHKDVKGISRSVTGFNPNYIYARVVK
jgi:oligopeptide transport system substrate-binding protein